MENSEEGKPPSWNEDIDAAIEEIHRRLRERAGKVGPQMRILLEHAGVNVEAFERMSVWVMKEIDLTLATVAITKFGLNDKRKSDFDEAAERLLKGAEPEEDSE